MRSYVACHICLPYYLFKAILVVLNQRADYDGDQLEEKQEEETGEIPMTTTTNHVF
jgi:hypothetical protein